jgi:hypothetical protein
LKQILTPDFRNEKGDNGFQLGEDGTFSTNLQSKLHFKINEKLSIEAVSCRFCQTDVISSGCSSACLSVGLCLSADLIFAKRGKDFFCFSLRWESKLFCKLWSVCRLVQFANVLAFSVSN